MEGTQQENFPRCGGANSQLKCVVYWSMFYRWNLGWVIPSLDIFRIFWDFVDSLFILASNMGLFSMQVLSLIKKNDKALIDYYATSSYVCTTFVLIHHVSGQGFLKMNFLGNFLVHLKKFIISSLHLMGMTTRSNWIEQHSYFRML